MGRVGADGAERGELTEGAEGTDVAATYVLSYGAKTMGIGFMALWVF